MAYFANITIRIDDKNGASLPKFDDKVFGGVVTGLACYDCNHTTHLAEEALEEIASNFGDAQEIAQKALNDINSHINKSLKGEL